MEKKGLLRIEGEDEIRKAISEAMKPEDGEESSGEKSPITEQMLREYLARHGKKGGTIVRTKPKVGRNDPCPCGSSKKFKKCCIDKEAAVVYNVVN